MEKKKQIFVEPAIKLIRLEGQDIIASSIQAVNGNSVNSSVTAGSGEVGMAKAHRGQFVNIK